MFAEELDSAAVFEPASHTGLARLSSVNQWWNCYVHVHLMEGVKCLSNRYNISLEHLFSPRIRETKPVHVFFSKPIFSYLD